MFSTSTMAINTSISYSTYEHACVGNLHARVGNVHVCVRACVTVTGLHEQT